MVTSFGIVGQWPKTLKLLFGGSSIHFKGLVGVDNSPKCKKLSVFTVTHSEL